jgi:hypothetical protein
MREFTGRFKGNWRTFKSFFRVGPARFFCGCLDSLTLRNCHQHCKKSKRGVTGSPESAPPQTGRRELFRRKNQTHECSTKNSPDPGRQEIAALVDGRPVSDHCPQMSASAGAKELLASLRTLPRDRRQARPHGIVGVRPVVASGHSEPVVQGEQSFLRLLGRFEEFHKASGAPRRPSDSGKIHGSRSMEACKIRRFAPAPVLTRDRVDPFWKLGIPA